MNIINQCQKFLYLSIALIFCAVFTSVRTGRSYTMNSAISVETHEIQETPLLRKLYTNDIDKGLLHCVLLVKQANYRWYILDIQEVNGEQVGFNDPVSNKTKTLYKSVLFIGGPTSSVFWSLFTYSWIYIVIKYIKKEYWNLLLV